MAGIAYDDQTNVILCHDARERIEIGAFILAFERREALRRIAEFVADGESDAALAEIQRKYAVGHQCHYRQREKRLDADGGAPGKTRALSIAQLRLADDRGRSSAGSAVFGASFFHH